MLAHDPSRLLALLPAVGLCSCVTPASVVVPEPFASRPVVEPAPEREPMTVEAALILSARESLAAGHYEAAYQSVSLALARQPNPEAVLLQIDAVIGLGDPRRAEAMLSTVARMGEEQAARRIALLELRNGGGVGPCEVTIETRAQPLTRAADPFAAWNELRARLPANHAIPIPADELEALDALCPSGCGPEAPSIAQLGSEDDDQGDATIALVLDHDDGSFSILADLLHPSPSSCSDYGQDDGTATSFELHGDLLHVRAFAERRDWIDASAWDLDVPAGLAAALASVTPPSSSYAYSGSSSSYSYGYSYGYGYGYGYSYSYGYYYGCGGGYDPEQCLPVEFVERDLVIDLARGEVVLDIVRTGGHGSALGRVTMAAQADEMRVEVDACGNRQTLALQWSR